MSSLFGVQFSPYLNGAHQAQSPPEQLYRDWIATLRIDPSHPPWQVIPQPGTTGDLLLRLFPPLTSWAPRLGSSVLNYTITEFMGVMITRLPVLADIIENALPLGEYATRKTNPYIASEIISQFINDGPFMPLLPHLIHDDQIDPLTYVIGRPGAWTPDMEVRNGCLYLWAGAKYFVDRQGLSEFDQATMTFGKHIPRYARVVFYPDEAARRRALASLAVDAVALEHLFQPTYGPHLIISDNSVVEISSIPILPITELVLLESILEAFRLNATVRPGDVPVRLTEAMRVVHGVGSKVDGMLLRLGLLSICAMNGFQLNEPVALYPTRQDVKQIVTRLRMDGDVPHDLYYVAHHMPVYQDCQIPYPLGFVVRMRANSGMPWSNATLLPPAEKPLRWLPAYTGMDVLITDADAIRDEYEVINVPVVNLFAYEGPVLVSVSSYDPAEGVAPVSALNLVPQHYFDADQSRNRATFSRYRRSSHRSLYKDVAVLTQAFRVVDDVTGLPVCANGYSMAYLGASSAHPDSNGPEILEQLRSGSIPGFPQPSSISQYGYDTERGAVTDLTSHPPTGTFTLVYADVDQVINGRNSMAAATNTAINLINVALNMVTSGGIVCFKVNFPDTNFWTQFFRQFSRRIGGLTMVKPFIVNNVEVFLVLGPIGGIDVPTPTTSIAIHASKIAARYQCLDQMMGQMPLVGKWTGDNDSQGPAVLSFMDYVPGSEDPDNTLAIGLSLIAATCNTSSLYLARYPNGSHVITTLYGYASIYPSSYFRRLASLPEVNVSIVDMQSRLTGEPAYSMFPVMTSNPFTMLAVGYNALIHNQTRYMQTAGVTHLCDLGTGPEMRILRFAPHDLAITMVDTRATSHPMNVFATQTVYEQADYLVPATLQGIPFDGLTAIFTLGAAAAGSQRTLRQVLDYLFQFLGQQPNMKRFVLQLNCPLPPSNGIPGLLEINRNTLMYNFPTLSRNEPCILPPDLFQLFTAHFPRGSFTWHYLTDTMDWIEPATLDGLGADTAAIGNAIALSQFTPCIICEPNIPMVDFQPAQFVVGQQGQARFVVPNPNAAITATSSGVKLFEADAGRVKMNVMQVRYQYDPTTTQVTLTWTVTTAGMYVVTAEQANIPIAMGSVDAVPPPPNFQVNWPANWDYTINGNDINVQYDPYYVMRLYVVRDQRYQPVNAQKATFATIAGNQVLSFVYDASDVAQQYWVMDYTPAAVGSRFAQMPAPLSAIPPPAAAPVRLTTPNVYARIAVYDGGNLITTLQPQPNPMPAGWLEDQDPTGVDVPAVTYQVPLGQYAFRVI
ncbi:VP1 [Reovirus GCRV104]|nr:VP1 [Reovirus GCRV104]